MNPILFHPTFIFVDIAYTKYHYSDNRRGSPMHYVALMLRGRAKIVTADMTLHVKEGEMFCIPKALPISPTGTGRMKSIFFPTAFSIWTAVRS